MSSKFNGFKRNAEACERRWRSAMEQKDLVEACRASNDYKKNIEAQEAELRKMDPQSIDYSKFNQSLEQQRNMSLYMGENQLFCQSDDLKNAYKELSENNKQLSKDMKKAIERCDTATYESLRSAYEKNIAAQESISKDIKTQDHEFKETIIQEKSNLLGHDISMRDKIGSKVAKLEAKGKNVSEEDKLSRDKYKNLVNEDEKEFIDYQNKIKSEESRNRSNLK